MTAATTAAPAPTISRAPVRYNLPPPPSELPASEAELAIALENETCESANAIAEDEEDESQDQEQDQGSAARSLRPGQQGFAERLMSKYGWSKGSGLGAHESGIINPLRVQLEKQKKKPDSEGGGFVGPRTGTIVGGQKSKKNNANTAGASGAAGKFGAMSEVVMLRGMVDGMDLDAEMTAEGEDGSGGLMQEIGEECGEKYGRVARVFIDRNSSDSARAPVFVKFTSQLSALRVRFSFPPPPSSIHVFRSIPSLPLLSSTPQGDSHHDPTDASNLFIIIKLNTDSSFSIFICSRPSTP